MCPKKKRGINSNCLGEKQIHKIIIRVKNGLEEIVKISCGNIELDGLFQHKSFNKAAVITHPHPLYGGTMDNLVVHVLQEELSKKGYSTLRFNFRQVYEQLTDIDSEKDLETAINFLKEKKGIKNILLAGYSYGSWINTRVVSKGLNISKIIMVSPPVAFLDYKNIKTISCPGLVVTGVDDDIAPPELVKKEIKKWNYELKFKLIKGCDHFYQGYLEELEKIISEYI